MYWFFASGDVQPWARVEPKSNSTDVEKRDKPPPYSYTNEAIELKDE